METHTGKEKWNRAAALYIRMQVFVMERDIPLKVEFDSEDHDEMIYVVIYDGEKPVATGRHKQIDSDTIRPGRVAVLKEYRKKGLGELVVKELEALGKKQGCTTSVIHGELSAAGFYEKLGYTRESDIYYEDGVPCVTLKKSL
ncbi:GNAT family N-acetyltransferase [Alkalibacterium sp. f15]|uniref:GNAT family N-acetyltransferase n=1 Tax=Alkalibacterium sp. f15 TaxID=3414029 RepID=UPI003BF87778